VFRYRFTIRFLLALTAVIGLALAAMRYPTKSGVVIAVTGTFAILAGAIIGAITSRGSVRACCIGFAIAGWLHAILAFTEWFGHGTGIALVSFYILHGLAPAFGNQLASNMFIEQTFIQNALANYAPGSPPALFYKYITIGQSLFTILAGALGAALASYFHTRSASHPDSN
jgi:hypothetical protein